jgi:hypothetical protein
MIAPTLYRLAFLAARAILDLEVAASRRRSPLPASGGVQAQQARSCRAWTSPLSKPERAAAGPGPGEAAAGRQRPAP